MTGSRKGCDSAGEPTPAQASAAYAAGVRFWGVYLAGPGAAMTVGTTPGVTYDTSQLATYNTIFVYDLDLTSGILAPGANLSAGAQWTSAALAIG